MVSVYMVVSLPETGKIMDFNIRVAESVVAWQRQKEAQWI